MAQPYYYGETGFSHAQQSYYHTMPTSTFQDSHSRFDTSKSSIETERGSSHVSTITFGVIAVMMIMVLVAVVSFLLVGEGSSDSDDLGLDSVVGEGSGGGGGGGAVTDGPLSPPLADRATRGRNHTSVYYCPSKAHLYATASHTTSTNGTLKK
ncbi:hypothetical protein MTO96_011105 [Rhipicephalus appendiculatus]